MYAFVNGTKLYYEVHGNGQPLILVHGNGEDHTIFWEAVQVLKPHFRCYVIDSRGHGRSGRVRHYSYPLMARDVLAFADKLQLRRPYFYGFSDGGIIGLLAALQRPDFFGCLMVSGANMHPHGVTNACYDEMRHDYMQTHNPLIELMLYGPHIRPEQLAAIQCPTLVTAGSADLIKPNHTRRLAQAIPGAQLRILEGEDHGSYIVHSDKIAHLILEFTGRA